MKSSVDYALELLDALAAAMTELSTSGKLVTEHGVGQAEGLAEGYTDAARIVRNAIEDDARAARAAALDLYA